MTRLTLAVWTLLLLPVAAQYRIRGYEPTSLPGIAVICNCFRGGPVLGVPITRINMLWCLAPDLWKLQFLARVVLHSAVWVAEVERGKQCPH